MAESFPFSKASTLLLLADNHQSVVAMREYATAKGAVTKIVPLTYDMRAADTHRYFSGGGKGGSSIACTSNVAAAGEVMSHQYDYNSHASDGNPAPQSETESQAHGTASAQQGHTPSHLHSQNLKKTITSRLANLNLHTLTTHLHHNHHNHYHHPSSPTSSKTHSPMGSKHAVHSLFAFPAQSNFSGVRHPLTWVRTARANGWHVLLDATAYASHTALDLTAVQPDFATVSFYKLFGFPTGVAALIVRRDALRGLLRCPWMCGRTGAAERDVDGLFMSLAMAVSPWATVPLRGWRGEDAGRRKKQKDGEEATEEAKVGNGKEVEKEQVQEEDYDDDLVRMFEDGALNYASIPAVSLGLDFLNKISMSRVHHHVSHLTRLLLSLLSSIHWSHTTTATATTIAIPTHHSSSSSSLSSFPSSSRAIRIYGPEHVGMRGGTVCFDVVRNGIRFDARRVFDAAALERITLGVGAFDNPGALEHALALDRRGVAAAIGRVRRNRQRVSRHNVSRAMARGYLGCVRVSVGVANCERDVRVFGKFVEALVRTWEQKEMGKTTGVVGDAKLDGDEGGDHVDRGKGDGGGYGYERRSMLNGSGRMSARKGALAIGRRTGTNSSRPASTSLSVLSTVNTSSSRASSAVAEAEAATSTDRIVGTAFAPTGFGHHLHLTNNKNNNNYSFNTSANLARSSTGSIDALRTALNADTDAASDVDDDSSHGDEDDVTEAFEEDICTPITLSNTTTTTTTRCTTRGNDDIRAFRHRHFDRMRNYQHHDKPHNYNRNRNDFEYNNGDVRSAAVLSSTLSGMRAGGNAGGRQGGRTESVSLSMSMSGFSLDGDGAKAQTRDDAVLYYTDSARRRRAGRRRTGGIGGRWGGSSSGRRKRATGGGPGEVTTEQEEEEVEGEGAGEGGVGSVGGQREDGVVDDKWASNASVNVRLGSGGGRSGSSGGTGGEMGRSVEGGGGRKAGSLLRVGNLRLMASGRQRAVDSASVS